VTQDTGNLDLTFALHLLRFEMGGQRPTWSVVSHLQFFGVDLSREWIFIAPVGQVDESVYHLFLTKHL
jgi:hypothetical protein